jgi:hypothetical protein
MYGFWSPNVTTGSILRPVLSQTPVSTAARLWSDAHIAHCDNYTPCRAAAGGTSQHSLFSCLVLSRLYNNRSPHGQRDPLCVIPHTTVASTASEAPTYTCRHNTIHADSPSAPPPPPPRTAAEAWQRMQGALKPRTPLCCAWSTRAALAAYLGPGGGLEGSVGGHGLVGGHALIAAAAAGGRVCRRRGGGDGRVAARAAELLQPAEDHGELGCPGGGVR